MSTTILAHPDAAPATALLNISGLRLILPQSEVHAVEAASDIDTLEADPFSIGWVQHVQQRWPVYCLSPELSLLIVVPKERRACVLLSAGAGYVGILCDEVIIDRHTALGKQHDLPPAMRLPDTPILYLMTLDQDDVACVTNTEQLAAHIARLVKR